MREIDRGVVPVAGPAGLRPAGDARGPLPGGPGASGASAGAGETPAPRRRPGRLGAILLGAVVSAAALAACSSGPPAPGYDGALPSPEGQRILRDCRDRWVSFDGGAVAGAWKVEWFAVVPSAAHGGRSGPTLSLRRDAVTAVIPVMTDTDAADVASRCGMEIVPVGPLSDPYRAATGR